MTLGERIAARRTAGGMSQADLAERLGVSRQSVSKWETDASVPDLDKLVRLGEIFGMTLDQLVKGEEAGPETAPEAPPAGETAAVRTPSGRIIAGSLLLGCGALVLLMCTVVGGPLEGLVLASPFAVCGALCLAMKRHAGLACGWVLWGMAYWFLQMATGIRPWWVLLPALYEMAGTRTYLLYLVIAWGQVLTLLALVFAAVRAFRKWRRGKRTP